MAKQRLAPAAPELRRPGPDEPRPRLGGQGADGDERIDLATVERGRDEEAAASRQALAALDPDLDGRQT